MAECENRTPTPASIPRSAIASASSSTKRFGAAPRCWIHHSSIRCASASASGVVTTRWLLHRCLLRSSASSSLAGRTRPAWALFQPASRCVLSAARSLSSRSSPSSSTTRFNVVPSGSSVGSSTMMRPLDTLARIGMTMSLASNATGGAAPSSPCGASCVRRKGQLDLLHHAGADVVEHGERRRG